MEYQDGTIHEIINYHKERADKAEQAYDRLLIRYTIAVTLAWSLAAGFLASLGLLLWLH